MKIMVDFGHPAHVHLFKNFIWKTKENGHEVLLTARRKDILLDLLNAYRFEYTQISSDRRGKSLVGLATELLKRDYELFKIARSYRPDIMVGMTHENLAHIGRILRIPSIAFADSESASLSNLLTFPFADVICTPSCFKKNLGKKQVRYEGYHELAYLHPNYFKADSSVLDELGLKAEDKFVILRFVAWQAAHDIRQHGFDMPTKRRLVKEIGKYARVLITSESPLPEEFEKHRITTPPEKIHDLLYYAILLIGDTQTMTTEAAVLGTPAVRCNSFVGSNDMANFIELERKYDLIYSFRESDKAIRKALELLQQPNLKEQWVKKRQRLLADKIDVTQFMIDFIENYPESFYKYKEGNRNQL